LSTTKILAINNNRVQTKTNKKQQPTMTPASSVMERSKTAKEQTDQEGEEADEEAWDKCFGAALQEEWLRFRRQVEHKSKEDEQAEQGVALFKDYLKMVDGRKKRQTESELCKLLCAWIVLKRRHERRQKWRSVTAQDSERVEMIEGATTPTRKTNMIEGAAETTPRTTNKKESREDTKIEVATPTRRMKARTPESPTNPIEELRQATEAQWQIRIADLRSKKRTLERWFHASQIKIHQVRYKRVLEEATKQAMARQKKQQILKSNSNQQVDAEWYDWQSNNQPTVTAKTQQLMKKRITLQYKYRQTILVADRALYEAQEAIEQPFPWFEATVTTDEEEDDNNYYFWHRGRPPEGDY
jgi:hypothetical protein